MIYREGKGLRMTAGMNRDARVYVAGHQGLVGGAIWRRLEKAGFTNLIGRTSKELDLREQAAVQRFFAEEKPDYVFLAAARVGGIRANNTYPAEFIYDNLMIQTNVLHQSYVHGVQKLLFLGSSCIYPKLSGKLEPTNEPYAVAKIAGVTMCQAYRRQYGALFFEAMPTNLFGPGDNFGPLNAHVIPGLMRRIHEAKTR